MRAWQVTRPGPLASRPLVLGEIPDPVPAEDELLVRVEACGVCRTDLHEAEGDLPVHRPGVVPGHEVVGEVVVAGSGQSRFAVGDRVGVAWLRSTCGQCRYCRSGRENLCPRSRYTGWDADGGYAELTTVPAAYAYPLPADRPAIELAPLLCAGIIGYRALRTAQLPPGGSLGIWGFGASAHLTAQVALAQGARVHVLTRGEGGRQLARELGVDSVAGPFDAPPEPLDSAIIFAPAGELVPAALAGLASGGTLALAGIHMSDVPAMSYERHLFHERTIRSVEANTRRDGAEFLALADRLRVRVAVTTYPFDAADQALADLREGRVRGAACLQLGSTSSS